MKIVKFPSSCFSLLSLLSLLLGLSSCIGGIQEPFKEVNLYVVDEFLEPIPDAKVEFYRTEADYLQDKNPYMEPLYTNEEGAVITMLESRFLDFYVNVEKGDANNWYTDQQLPLPSVETPNVHNVTIIDSFEKKIAGKHKKRWIQTYEAINGAPFSPSCDRELYHDFDRDGVFKKFTSSKCDEEGIPKGFGSWKYGKDTNTLTLLTKTGFKRYKIVSVTDTELNLEFYPLPDVKQELRFELVK